MKFIRNLFLSLSLLLAFSGNAQILNNATLAEWRIPSDAVIAMVTGGQSNDIGRGESERYVNISGYEQLPHSVYIYYKTAYGATDNGSWAPADAYNNTKEPNVSGSQRTFGSYLPLATYIRDALGKPIYIIATGRGGVALHTGVTAQSWDPANTGSQFDIATDQYIDVALTKLATDNPGKPIYIIAWLWHQGESDATDATATANYSANFSAFVTAFRASNSLLKTTPLVITKLWFAKSANETTINGVFDAYKATNPATTVIVDVSDQPQKDELTVPEIGGYTATAADDNHQSYLAQIAKAQRTYNAIAYYYKTKNNLPPIAVTAPVISGSPLTSGTTFASTVGLWRNAPTSYSYQWKRDAVNISGETASTYVTTSSDLSTSLTCAVTATNAYGSNTQTSNSLAIAAPTVPTFVAAGTRSTGVSAPAPTIPAGSTTNDILLLVVETSNNTVAAPSAPAGWVAITNSPQGFGTSDAIGSTSVNIFWKRHSGSEATPTMADPGEHVNAQIFAFRGCVNTGNPWSDTAGSSNASATTAFSATGPTSTTANELAVIVVVSDIDSSTARWTTANNMACGTLTSITNREDQSTNAGNGGGIAVWTGTKATAGAYGSVTATANNATAMAWLIVSLKAI